MADGKLSLTGILVVVSGYHQALLNKKQKIAATASS